MLRRLNPVLGLIALASLSGSPRAWAIEAGDVIGTINVAGQDIPARSNGYTPDGKANHVGQWQCVELAKRVIKAKGGVLPSLGEDVGAVEIFRRAGGLGEWKNFTVYKNDQAAIPPRACDLIVYDDGALGHVAVVKSVESDKVVLIEQNWSMIEGELEQPLARPQTGYSLPSRSKGRYRPLGWVRWCNGLTPPEGMTLLFAPCRLKAGMRVDYMFCVVRQERLETKFNGPSQIALAIRDHNKRFVRHLAVGESISLRRGEYLMSVVSQVDQLGDLVVSQAGGTERTVTHLKTDQQQERMFAVNYSDGIGHSDWIVLVNNYPWSTGLGLIATRYNSSLVSHYTPRKKGLHVVWFFADDKSYHYFWVD